MYNHNNNGKYLIHYGRKGMKWGQHIFTQDEGLGGLFRRKKKIGSTHKKLNELLNTGKYKLRGKADKTAELNFLHAFKDDKGKLVIVENDIGDVDRLSDRDLDKAILELEDPRGNTRRRSGLIQGLNESYKRNDISPDPNKAISQYYSMTDNGPMITVTAYNVDGQGHYGSGVYYVNTGEFGKNDFVIDG